MRKYIPIFSQSASGGGGELIGTIIARYNSTFVTTDEASKYLFCDGSTFNTSKYPKLYKVLGTNILPDLRERYLQGNIIGGKYLEAGLPNITGLFSGAAAFLVFNGAFYNYKVWGYENSAEGQGWNAVGFDASRSNSIYGNSETVRPPSMTVRYYIRAK